MLPLPGTEEARLERELKDSAPPDPQMLHEHIPRGTRATPLSLLPLDSGHAPQPRRSLSSLTQKCFIFLPDPHAGKASHLQLRFFAVVWVGRGGRGNAALAQSLLASASSLGFPRSDDPALLLTPLGIGSLLQRTRSCSSSSSSSSLSPAPAPCEERVNIYFLFICFFWCVPGWVCIRSQGV